MDRLEESDRDRKPIIKPGAEWEAAVKMMLYEATQHDRLLENEWAASELLHRIVDAVEGVRYANEKPRPVIDRPEA